MTYGSEHATVCVCACVCYTMQTITESIVPQLEKGSVSCQLMDVSIYIFCCSVTDVIPSILRC